MTPHTRLDFAYAQTATQKGEEIKSQTAKARCLAIGVCGGGKDHWGEAEEPGLTDK